MSGEAPGETNTRKRDLLVVFPPCFLVLKSGRAAHANNRRTSLTYYGDLKFFTSVLSRELLKTGVEQDVLL